MTLRGSIVGSLALLASLMTLGCATAQRPPRVNPAVIVLPNATNVRWAEIYDGQVTYNLTEPYPADTAIREIQNRLRQLGWRPRRVDFLNPDGSSATTATWSQTEIDGRDVRAWAQQWESDSGDIVQYGLAYRTKAKDDIPRVLEVVVSYFTSATVKMIEAEGRRDPL